MPEPAQAAASALGGSEPAHEATPLIASGPAHGLSRGRLTVLIAALYFGVMLAAVDTTIVTTLMGHIASDLHELSNISWAATGYTIAYSAFQPMYGKFSDIFGRKRVSLFCLMIFALGCQMCGSARNLIAGRFVSGVGAGGVLSMSTITVSDYVPLRARGIFQGLGNVAFGTGASLGGVLGGWLTSYGGWRLAFTAQVPVTLVCALFQWMYLENNKTTTASDALHSLERIDWMGSASLVSSLLLFMLAVTTGGSQIPWLSWQMAGLFVASALLFTLFIYWEKNVAREPVMPLNIILHRTVLSACFANFFATGVSYAFLYYTPLLLQAVYHYTYVEISHRMIASFVAVATGSLGAGFIMRRTGKYYALEIASCGLLILASTLLFVVRLYFPALMASPAFQSLAYVLNGLGYASMLTVTLIALISAVEPKFQATSTAAQYTFRGAGSSIGIALAAAVFQNSLRSALVRNVGTDTEKKREVIRKVSESLEAIWESPKKYQPKVIAAYNRAGLAVQGFLVVWGLFALVASVLMEEHDLEARPSGAPESEPASEPRATTPPGPLTS